MSKKEKNYGEFAAGARRAVDNLVNGQITQINADIVRKTREAAEAKLGSRISRPNVRRRRDDRLWTAQTAFSTVASFVQDRIDRSTATPEKLRGIDHVNTAFRKALSTNSLRTGHPDEVFDVVDTVEKDLKQTGVNTSTSRDSTHRVLSEARTPRGRIPKKR